MNFFHAILISFIIFLGYHVSSQEPSISPSFSPSMEPTLVTFSPSMNPTIYPHADTKPFLWLVIVGGFVSFAMAWGIGANDVANAFSTSIGARAINIKQAVIIAGTFEFLGALLLGSKVTDTIRKKIVDYDEFIGEEDLLMLGMFSALCSGAFWLAAASKWSLPVSTTHTIIGSVLGFAWVAKGFDSIAWDEVGLVVLFWIVAPVACGVCGVIFYLPLRSFVLRRDDSYKCTMRIWPFFVWVVIFIMSFFIMIKGGGGNKQLKKWAKQKDSEGPGFYIILGIAAAIGVAAAIIAAIIFIVPYNCPETCCRLRCESGKISLVQRFVNWQVEEKARLDKEVELKTGKSSELVNIKSNEDGTALGGDTSTGAIGTPTGVNGSTTDFNVMSKSGDHAKLAEASIEETTSKSRLNRYKDALTYGVKVDIHEGLDALENTIHTQSEPFDFETEKAFSWLQVLTASLDIFAHGSNDVANAIAPFAAMVGLYAEVEKVMNDDGKANVPAWILLLGGLGMTIGLATYGYNIMKVLGVRMAAMSSTRGYCIELASALVIIICSHNGLPASTTHAQVGSTLGVGLCELCWKDSKLTWKQIVNWKLLAQVFLGWILTLVIGAGVSAGIYAFIAYSPCAV